MIEGKMIDLKLSLEDSLILLCCCINPEENRVEKMENILSGKLNWDYIYNISSSHGVSNFIHKNVEQRKNKAFIPTHILENLEKKYHTTAYRNLLLSSEYNDIVTDFNNANIKIMPLKGMAFLKELYHNIGLRSFSDIDILVEKKGLNRAEQLLKDMGYIKKYCGAPRAHARGTSLFISDTRRSFIYQYTQGAIKYTFFAFISALTGGAFCEGG